LGVFIDLLLIIFRINGKRAGVSQKRLIGAMALSTLFIAVTSYSTFALFPQFVPFAKQFWGIGLFIQRSAMLDMLVLFMGTATGGVAGYATSYLWNKYLRHIWVH